MTGQDSIALRMKIYVYDRKNVLKKEKRGRVGENEKKSQREYFARARSCARYLEAMSRKQI